MWQALEAIVFIFLKNLEAEKIAECIVKQRPAVAIALRHVGNDHAQGVGNLHIAHDGQRYRRAAAQGAAVVDFEPFLFSCWCGAP